jgi:putative ABC transport system substrate-binding protein
MKRRAFIGGAIALSAAPLAAEAQPAGKVYRIGVLNEGRPLPPGARSGLALGLGELGWIDGQNCSIVRRDADGDLKRLPVLANDLVRLPVDVIVAVSNLAIAAAKQATTSIPIVMLWAGDPVGSGFVASLARPGGNVTGTTTHPPEVARKLLEVLKDALPGARRVSIILEPEWPGMAAYVREADAAARSLGLRLQYLEVRGSADVDAALARVRREPPDVLYVAAAGAVGVHQQRIITFARERKLPTIWPESAFFARAGGLISYGLSTDESFRQAAALVDKILKGAKPADLPVEQPTKFDLVINLKTAKTLGLTIPAPVLARADQIIQ